MIITNLKDIPFSPVSHNPDIQKQVILNNQQLPPVTQFAQATFPPKAIAPAHHHDDMLEVFFVQSGEGVMTVNGVEHPLQAGSCISIEPKEVHELRNASDTEALVVSYFGVSTEVKAG